MRTASGEATPGLDDELTNGYPNYWYPISWSKAIRRKPVAVQVLGERVVLVRDSGALYALADRCPHRGVPLSHGRQVFPGTLSCIYHGWTYDLASGRLVAALTAGPECPVVGKVQVRRYPVEERAGLVWIYVGEGEPPPVENDVPEEVLASGVAICGVLEKRFGDWRLGAEAAMDEAHSKFLHRNALMNLFKSSPAWTRGVQTEESADGEWLLRVRDGVVHEADYPGLGRWPRDPWWKWRRGRSASTVSMRMPCLVRVEKANWTNFEFYVPVSKDNHIAVFLMVKQGSWLGRVGFLLYYRLYLSWMYVRLFNGQDRWMIEAMTIPPERLFGPDIVITHWRKWTRERAARRRDLVGQGQRGEAISDSGQSFASATENSASSQDVTRSRFQ